MPEEVLFKSEEKIPRSEVSEYLRAVADKLEADQDITLESGNQKVSVSPPSTPTFEVKVERETSGDGSSEEMSIEFELEWKLGEEGESNGNGLTIE